MTKIVAFTQDRANSIARIPHTPHHMKGVQSDADKMQTRHNTCCYAADRRQGPRAPIPSHQALLMSF